MRELWPKRYFRAPDLASPPAVWTAFAQMSAFKSWLLVAELFVIGFLLVLVAMLLSRPPDVVLVDGEGDAAFVGGGADEAQLLSWLKAHRGQPSSLEERAFAERFVELAVALNSSTVREAWPTALSMMSPSARARAEAEAASTHLVESFEAQALRTDVQVKAFKVVSRAGESVLLSLELERTRSRLSDGASPSKDALSLSLLLHLRERTREAPSGLEVAEWRLQRREVSENTPEPEHPENEGAAP